MVSDSTASRLALLGGPPVRGVDFPSPPLLTPQERAEVAAVLTLSAWSGLAGDEPPGPVTRLEQAWAEIQGGGEAVAVSSGTTALALVMRALGLGPGEEVIVPAYGCVAPEMAVLEAGGVPAHSDILPESYCLSPADAARRCSERTRGVIAVHFGGQVAEFAELAEWARRAGLWLIEDAALAPGGVGRAGPVGSVGVAATFSLGVDKPIHAGEGGVIWTRDPRLAGRCRSLRSLGLSAAEDEPEHDWPGGNHRMTALQAAVALPQLARLERDRHAREENAHRILAALAPGSPFRPLATAEGRHAWSQLWLHLDLSAGVTPARVAEAFQAEGIPLFRGWSRPNYAYRLYTPERAAVWLRTRSSPLPADFYARTRCPAAENAAFDKALLLPLAVLRAPAAVVEDVVSAFDKIRENWDALGWIGDRTPPPAPP